MSFGSAGPGWGEPGGGEFGGGEPGEGELGWGSARRLAPAAPRAAPASNVPRRKPRRVSGRGGVSGNGQLRRRREVAMVLAPPAKWQGRAAAMSCAAARRVAFDGRWESFSAPC